MERIRSIPVGAIHGSKDRVVPLSAAQRAVSALAKAGGDVRFTVLDGYPHSVWTVTYTDPALNRWLLEHARPGGRIPVDAGPNLANLNIAEMKVFVIYN